MSKPNGKALPDPLVPDECDLGVFKDMPLEIERLRKSKTWLRCRRTPELAFYVFNLWMRAYHERPAGGIDNDDDVLCSAADCPPADWARLKAHVMDGWIACNDGRVYHPVVAEKVLVGWAGRLRARYNSYYERNRKAAYRAKLEQSPPPTPAAPFAQWLSENYPKTLKIASKLFPDEKTAISAVKDDLSHGTSKTVPRDRTGTMGVRPPETPLIGIGIGIGSEVRDTPVPSSAPSSLSENPPLSRASKNAHGHGHAPDPTRQKDFLTFWKAIQATTPRRASRAQAERIFIALDRYTDILPDVADLIAAWDAYVSEIATENGKNKGRHQQIVRYPHSWLKERVFENYIAEVQSERKLQQQRETSRAETIQHWNGKAAPVITAIGAARFDALFLGSHIDGNTLHMSRDFLACRVEEDPKIYRALVAQFGETITISSPERKAKAKHA